MTNLLIHYPPGARGDFLAAFLVNDFIEHNKHGVIQPLKHKHSYIKIHHIKELFYKSIEKISGTRIRIDPNYSAYNYVEICFNHFYKQHSYLENKTEANITEFLPAYRLFNHIDYIIKIDEEVIKHKESYSHWIDFSMLKDSNFLYSLYQSINNKNPPAELFAKVLQNINNQFAVPKEYLECEQYAILERSLLRPAP